MTAISLARYIAFGTAIFCAIIDLALGADLIALAKGVTSPFTFAAMGLAIGLITLITLGPMLGIDHFRKGSFTSWVVVEIPVVTLLWILWLTTAGLAASSELSQLDCSVFGVFDSFGGLATTDPFGSSTGSSSNPFGSSSSDPFGLSGLANEGKKLESECNAIMSKYRAIEAFAFLAWLALMGYGSLLSIVSLMAQNNGNSAVWTSTVRETNFFAKKAPSANISQPTNVYGVPEHKYPPANGSINTGYTGSTPSPGPNGQYNPYAAQV